MRSGISGKNPTNIRSSSCKKDIDEDWDHGENLKKKSRWCQYLIDVDECV